MCSHYQSVKNREKYRRHFGIDPPDDLGRYDVWPMYHSVFIRRHPLADVGDDAVPEREALLGNFGMIHKHARDLNAGRHTYNARVETVSEKVTYRSAWKRAQHCIIPADAFFEPDWATGRSVPTRIQRADGCPMGIAGLWEDRQQPDGTLLLSFTMLTVNADAHEVMKRFHRPGEEKRMVVILPEAQYGAWLDASAADSYDFMRPYPAGNMVASALPSAASES